MYSRLCRSGGKTSNLHSLFRFNLKAEHTRRHTQISIQSNTHTPDHTVIPIFWQCLPDHSDSLNSLLIIPILCVCLCVCPSVASVCICLCVCSRTGSVMERRAITPPVGSPVGRPLYLPPERPVLSLDKIAKRECKVLVLELGRDWESERGREGWRNEVERK